MKEVKYSDISDIDELKYYYPIINEAKHVDDKDKENLKKSNPILSDKRDVVYGDDLNELHNIFKHIIIFTNNKNPKENKTLGNIYDAIDAMKKAKCEIIPKLHIFIAADMNSNEMEKHIEIYDTDEKMVIEDESNIDTLIFSRLGVQNEDNCEHIVEVLQDRGFLVLNPLKYSELASNKYKTAELLKNGDVPQPNFCLMTKDILYDEKLYNDSMKDVYSEWDDKDSDKNEKLSFVVKILDGHGGTGVMLIDGKKILAILQTIFAIDEERQLIIQRKEEGMDGDLRVHVLTLRDKQVILGAMKRQKIKSDFRSNVSLGASAIAVKLTPEQEQIALKAAALSQLPWCAVDIMPLVKGSNKEIGDNVVLELNASPGTDGISDVLNKNFINIIINNLTDPSSFYLQEKTAGYIEAINLTYEGGISKDYLAKLDTGNSTKASMVEVGEYVIDGDNISFKINDKPVTYKIIDYSNANVGQEIHRRPIINMPVVQLGRRKICNVPFSIVKDRDEKNTNVLLNRDIISKLGYVVNPNKTHILTEDMEKVKII